MTLQRNEVLVALSGGLDSAAVVLLLREAGYRPRALFLDMQDSAAERERALNTAAALGVELTIEPCAALFRNEILGYVLAEHTAGRTPAPCSRCNPRIKWHLLAQVADRLGIHHIATGHYVRTVTASDGHLYFRRGIDPAKDQSYYLWDVPEDFIRRAVLPLGDRTKAEVRSILKERHHLTELAARRESMGVCFLGGLSYGDFVRSRLPEGAVEPGEVVGLSGEVVGAHDGYPLYTAGQKRGFSLFNPENTGLAVLRVDAVLNQIVVGPAEALLNRIFTLKAWRATCLSKLLLRAAELRVVVRGIGRNPTGGCRLTIRNDGRLEVILLHDTAWALMPGQPVVFYLDDRVAGGGILDEVVDGGSV